MSKSYLVFDTNNKFKGILANKLDALLFQKQRDMTQFSIHEMKDKKLKKLDVERIFEFQLNDVYGVMMFPDEELYMYEGFGQMQMDFRNTTGKILKDITPFVKFSDDEFSKIEEFLQIVYETLDEVETLIENEDESFDMNNFYNMHKLGKTAISKLGGKE
jgi:hypothetical protein